MAAQNRPASVFYDDFNKKGIVFGSIGDIVSDIKNNLPVYGYMLNSTGYTKVLSVNAITRDEEGEIVSCIFSADDGSCGLVCNEDDNGLIVPWYD